jgi:hypothetical protein
LGVRNGVPLEFPFEVAERDSRIRNGGVLRIHNPADNFASEGLSTRCRCQQQGRK